MSKSQERRLQIQERYGTELDECAEMLQVWHPISKVKAIGRLEVATALRDILDRFAKLENVALLAKLIQEEDHQSLRSILKRQGWVAHDIETGLMWSHPERRPFLEHKLGTESAGMAELDLALKALE